MNVPKQDKEQPVTSETISPPPFYCVDWEAKVHVSTPCEIQCLSCYRTGKPAAVPKQDDQPTPTDRDFECPYIQRCSFPLCIDTASREFDKQCVNKQCVNSRIRAKLAQPEEPPLSATTQVRNVESRIDLVDVSCQIPGLGAVPGIVGSPIVYVDPNFDAPMELLPAPARVEQPASKGGSVAQDNYMRQVGPWKCINCGHEVPYDPDWNVMAKAFSEHYETHFTQPLECYTQSPTPPATGEAECEICGKQRRIVQMKTLILLGMMVVGA